MKISVASLEISHICAALKSPPLGGRKGGLVLAWFIMLLGVLTSCSDDTPTPSELPAEAVVEVPITVELETAWNVDAEGADAHFAPPPGSGDYHGDKGSETISEGWVDAQDDVSGVDRVRIIAFKRKDPDMFPSADQTFRYDASNDKVLARKGTHETIFTGDHLATDHSHPYWEGTLTKIYGYEYRVVAIAYSATRTLFFSSGYSGSINTKGEQNWFTLNVGDGLALEDFMMTVKTEDADATWGKDYLRAGGTGKESVKCLSEKLLPTPQLFWGELHLKDSSVGDASDPIIRFSETDAAGDEQKNLPLTGLLYRGMAKVELRIIPKAHKDGLSSYDFSWLALLADGVRTQVGLSAYDDFLTPLESSRVAADGSYTALDFKSTSEKDGDYVVLSAWVLPVKTHLAFRGAYKKGLDYRAANAQLVTDNLSYSDLGTGIISADVADNVFFFRRNHKYVIICKDSEAMMTKASMN